MTSNAYVLSVYTGSDGDATQTLYAQLSALGAAGVIAVNLLRASKASERAKVYRGGSRQFGKYFISHRRAAYDRKNWSLGNLDSALREHAEALGIAWGWGEDENQPFHRHVLYVDLPTGQVSFYSEVRGNGPAYGGNWDGVRGAGGGRICAWAARLLDEAQS